MPVRAFCLIFCWCLSQTVFADIAVVGNPSVKFDSLTKEQVADIFLGKKSRFPDGSTVIPVDEGLGSDIREEFYRKVIGMTGPQMKAYWSREIFSGKARPPLQEDEEARVKKLIASNPSLLGYIDKKSVDNTIKVLLIIDHN